MRISDIMSLAKEYLLLGMTVAVFAAVLFLLGYFVIYRKLLKGNRKMKPGRLVLYGIFICYLVVVFGATMLSRGSFWENHIQWRLFYSYREAWNHFSATEWRNIILNILLFVPFGFLLPLLFPRFRMLWKTYLAGLALTVFIEVGQLVLKRGIFELDDIFDNFLGAMIGYGLYRIFRYIISPVKGEKEKRDRFVPVLLCQIPLGAAVGLFATIFTVYANQELGNLNTTPIYTVSNVQVESTMDYSEEAQSAPVYRLHVASVDETRAQAKKFFEAMGVGLDEGRTDIYEQTAVYYSKENGASLWINYAGSTISYTDFDARYGENASEEKSDAAKEEVASALKELGVFLPEGVSFENPGEGSYLFEADKLLIEDILYDGSVTCTYTEDGTISSFRNNIVAYQPYKVYSIISEKQAYENLKAGKFNPFWYDSSSSGAITVKGLELDYEVDTKGFYQPVYTFEIETAAGEEGYIYIPALR